MTAPIPAPPPAGTGPDGAHGSDPAAAAVAGLAREVEELRKRLEPLIQTPARVDALARLVAQLADTVTALTARSAVAAPPSWLMAPTDPEHTRELLDALTGWMAQVYLRYADASEALPERWCWHPDVVEELLWLMHAWLAAYQGKHASVQLVGDWHDRQRPGVVRRISKVAGRCSRENHQTRHGWTSTPTAAPVVPSLDGLDAIADWWGTGREQTAPEPAVTAGART
ncbi:hypothetical protein [Pseudonocardia humida]|uniref:DUF4913 domain-containing protein n=1 Tax=Pseudonocardia humida TaxID=2800819 RepID=A0ABT1A534_9PSEU|nr:hypothetical protein [Pseudonocardia humida]MCO1658120.1 hypothetical protein [Pseudonocardia humida]